MFKEILDAVKARRSLAPSTWRWEKCYELYDGVHWALVAPENPGFVVNPNLVTISTEDVDGIVGRPINAAPSFQFIENAPNDISWCIAEIERLNALVEQLRNENEHLQVAVLSAETDAAHFQSELDHRGTDGSN